MTIRWPSYAGSTIALLLGCLLFSGALQAQTGPELSYIRALGDHHGLPASEVGVLAEWRLPVAEIAVVLEVSERAGVSPDALVASRRNGRTWPMLASRYGLDVTSFHVELTDPPEPVAELYAALAGLPRSRWGEAPFDDRQMIFLVNVSFLQAYAKVSGDVAAAALARTGSPAEALRALGS